MFLLGMDLGTGSVKALLMSETGTVLGEASAPYPVNAPHPGWAESSPEEWWEAVGKAVREAVGSRGAEVMALGLSGQMHGVVLSDASGHPLRPAMLWADTRSREQLDAYRRLDETLRRSLANPPAVGMAGPSLLWLRDHEPETYEAARWALQPKDWLRLRLTGEAAAEPSDASATLLYDLEDDDWSTEIVGALGLRTDFLAPLVGSADAAGILTREAAGHLALPDGLPVAAGAADTAAAILGSGLRGPGLPQLTVGTGGQIVAVRSRPAPDPRERIHLYRTAWEKPGRFYSMAAIQNAGLALEWARKVLGATWEDVYREVFDAPPGAGNLLFLPYLSGERTPRFDPDARGAWVGLGLGHERGHLLRAALEGVAFALREGLEALEATGIRAPELRLAGGGASEESWRQLLADVLGRPLRLLPDSAAASASARGAAILAGLASGIYETPEDILALAPELQQTMLPGSDSSLYEIPYSRFRELYPRLYG
jgi:xylulokinase